MGLDITPEQRNALKAKGFLSNKNCGYFSARIITENGVLEAEKMKMVCAIANQYGNGTVTLTARMTIELPGIAFENIDQVVSQLSKGGMVTGGTGAKIRPIVACKGTVCVHGNIDTQQMASVLHKRFYEGFGHVVLPHKFKIAVGGCPNSCVKPNLNDIGIVGVCRPNFQKELCKGCKQCAVVQVCPMNACQVADGVMVTDQQQCNHCGCCIGKCTFGAIIDGETGYRVYVGGRWGKTVRVGTLLPQTYTQDQAMDLVEKAICVFKEQGAKGERFASVVERVGAEKLFS